MPTELPSSEFAPSDLPGESSSAPVVAARPQAGHFYRVDSSRSSFREMWRDTRSPLVVIAWLSKLLRIKLPGSVNDPNVVALHPFLLTPDEAETAMPAEVQDKLAPVLRELTDLGFGQPLYFAMEDRFHHCRTFHVAMLHREGRSVARVVHRTEGIQKTRAHFFTEFISGFASGRILLSSSARSQMLPPPGCELNYDHRATASQLWVSHRQQIDTIRCSGESVLTLRTPDEMLDLLERHHEAVRDFQLSRGVFASMRGEDLIEAQALDRNVEQARAGQMRHPEVMARLERLQQKKMSWTSAILVLIVSLGLFVGASAAGSRGAGANGGGGLAGKPGEFLLIILGVLFVHELGHYVAMKVFRYRNVRMFFIPFFGAAVSGQNYTAPGWKKVVVSLMGPLPGIALGGALGIAGLIKDNDLMTKIGMFATILNAFQLLPVLPLDGGHVLHSVLFCRHYSLDVLFRVVAGALLVAASGLSGDKFFMYIGIFMLVSIPTAFKIAKTATELRREKLVITAGSDADEHTIPVSAAEAIIDRVQTRFPKLKNPKTVATLTLQTYEMLAARPPGVLASISLLLLHGGAFLVSLVLFAVLLIPQFGGWGAIFEASAWQPKHSLEVTSIEVWPAGEPPMASPAAQTTGKGNALRDHDSIVATFSSLKEARETFEGLRRQVPARGSLVLFGDSVFMSIPLKEQGLQASMLGEFEKQTKDVFIDSAEGFRTSLTLTCVPAKHVKAEDIRRELETYFQGSKEMWLIPPWADGQVAQRPEADRAREALARMTYQKLRSASVYDAPELKALSERMLKASRRGFKSEYRRLAREQAQLRHDLRLRKLQGIRDGADGPVVRELAERYISIDEEVWKAEQAAEASKGAASQAASAPEEGTGSDDNIIELYKARYRREGRELGPLMGQLPLQPGSDRPAPADARLSAHGYSTLLKAGWIAVQADFEDVAQGAPAMVRWLQARGCDKFKYDLSSSEGMDYEEED